MELKRVSRCGAVARVGLLIVPCGIETVMPASRYFSTSLLIVPCGIETTALRAWRPQHGAFNRTLWN